MANESLRQALESKKAEIEEALRQLDHIESLAGLRKEPPPSVNGMSYSQAVLEALKEGPKTSDQLTGDLGLTAEQVYHAATTHRLRKIVDTWVADGVRHYAVKQGVMSNTTPGEVTTLTDAVVRVLQGSPHPLTAPQVTSALEGAVPTTAGDFGRSVASTLANLAKAGRIRRVGPGRYIQSSGLIPLLD